jgi:hypothetical protein
MQRVMQDPEDLAYPNLGEMQCGYCSVAALCRGMNQGDDVAWIRENQFRVKDARWTVPNEEE